MGTSTQQKLRQRVVSRIRRQWEWVLCFVVLMILNLFLAGEDLFGLRGSIAAVLALVGGLVLPIITFIFAGILAPLVTALVGIVMTLLTPILTFLIGTLIMPVVTLFTGLVSAILAWLATTWLGVMLAPVINTVSPLVLQFGPWVAGARNTGWLMKKLMPWLRKSQQYLRRNRSEMNKEVSKVEGKLRRSAKPKSAAKRTAKRNPRRS